MAIDSFANHPTPSQSGLAWTTLDSDITASATSFTVANGAVLPVAGTIFGVAYRFRMLIVNELIIVTERNGNTIVSCIRGAEGTAATPHAAGTGVRHVFTAGATQALPYLPLSGGTLRDTTPSTGVTSVTIRAGAGQGGTDLLTLTRADGSTAVTDAASFRVSGSQLSFLCPFITVSQAGRFDVNAEARLASNQQLGWSNNTTASAANADVALHRDATGVLAQRVGTAAQAFRVYNTFTDTSNGEWGALRWNGNVLEIGTFANGTGTVRKVHFVSGNVGFGVANAEDVIHVAGGTNSGITLNNTNGIRFKDTGGIPRETLALDAANNMVNRNNAASGDAYYGIGNGSNGGSVFFQTQGTNRLTISAAGLFTVADASNFAFATATGTKIGTATTQKIGFFNATPVTQRSDMGANDGSLASVAAQANAIRTALRDIGLVA
jgi:hypothetical protein